MLLDKQFCGLITASHYNIWRPFLIYVARLEPSAHQYDFSIVASMDFRHYAPNLPLPLGIKASMDTDGVKVRLTEPYVRQAN